MIRQTHGWLAYKRISLITAIAAPAIRAAIYGKDRARSMSPRLSNWPTGSIARHRRFAGFWRNSPGPRWRYRR
jgi:hypothetical protein